MPVPCSSSNTLPAVLTDSRILDLTRRYDECVRKQEVDMGFNLFSLISEVYYRENLHSDIMWAILDPQGKHGHADLFLRLFLKFLREQHHVNVRETDYTNVTIFREQGRVDLLICDKQSGKAIIVENYSRALLSNEDLPWLEILALDAIQKGLEPDEETLQVLRRKGLIEGRKPALHVAATIAAATGDTAEYIRHRAFDDAYYCDLILEYLKTFGQGTRADFRRLILDKLSDVLSPKQKEKKIHNLLQKLRREGKVVSAGKTSAGKWKLPQSAPDQNSRSQV